MTKPTENYGWSDTSKDNTDWLQDLCLESTLRWARGNGWVNRQHMLWGLSWPLPVGRDALRWWADSRKACGWAGLPYSADGSRIENLSDVQERVFIDGERPLTDAEELDVDINVEALPLPRRDFPPDEWLGLAVPRRNVWLFGTVRHIYGLDDRVYNRPVRDELRFGEPLRGWPMTLELPRREWNALRRWYGDTFEGRYVRW